MAWLPYVPTILSALVQLAKLLLELAAKNQKEDIKQCSAEIDLARKSGDTSRLEELLKRMREGKSCE